MKLYRGVQKSGLLEISWLDFETKQQTDKKIHQLMQTIESESINQAVKPCLLHMGHHSGRRDSHHYHELYFISHI